MSLHFSTGWLFDICLCVLSFLGGVVGWIMQEVGDEPSQGGSWAEMRHSMTCFRRVCIIQHQASNLFSCLSYCRFFFLQLKTSEKSVSHQGISSTLIHAAGTPPLPSQNNPASSSASLNSSVSPSSPKFSPGWLDCLISNFIKLMLAMVQSHMPAEALQSQSSAPGSSIKHVSWTQKYTIKCQKQIISICIDFYCVLLWKIQCVRFTE